MTRMERRHCYGVDLERQRKALLESRIAAPFAADILSRAETALDKTYEVLKMSEYMEFCENGNRKNFETKYLERRNNASYLSIALWLTRDEKYIRPLTDHIFCICDEFSWCLPAHSFMWEKPPVERVIKYVDLFAAETARLLTEIVVSVGTILPYYVTERIRYELHRRIIEAFKECDHFHWEDYRSNWPAVCAGGTLAALLHFGSREEIEEIMPRLFKAAELFLTSYGEDGCCQEGYDYWNYGFGHFVIFAGGVLEYTEGAVNYFGREKVRKIAAYPRKIRMGTTRNVSFADGSSRFTFSVGLMCYLKKLYPEEVSLPDLRLGTLHGNIYSIKELLWFDPDYQMDTPTYGTYYFEDAQWFVRQGEGFSFAAKAGYNNEPHNHNDLGSFMIVTGDDMPLADFGSAEYTRDTFDENARYKMLNHASWGHSVPMIDGHCQREGGEYRATDVRAGESTFSMDISGAYESGVIKKLTRRFEIKERAIILKDSYEYTEKTRDIRERFVTYTLPVVSDGRIDLTTARILFEREKYRVDISEDSYKDHDTSKPVKVYLIDVVPIREHETEFLFKIEINE